MGVLYPLPDRLILLLMSRVCSSGGVATDYINMESMVAAAGLMAAAGVDCPDSSIAASQRVFDLLNQGYHNERHPLANPSLQGHHETGNQGFGNLVFGECNKIILLGRLDNLV